MYFSNTQKREAVFGLPWNLWQIGSFHNLIMLHHPLLVV